MYNLLTTLYILAVAGSSIGLGLGVARSRTAGTATGTQVTDPLEGAFLLGGPGRVADTVIAAMHADGRIAVTGPGTIGVVRPVSYHPVEDALLAAHAAASGSSLHWTRIGVMRSPAVQAVGDGLAARGLLMRPGPLRTLRRWASAQAVLCFVSFPASIMVTVMQEADNALGDHRPPFVFNVAPAIFAGLVVAFVCVALTRSRLTGSGKVARGLFLAQQGEGDLVRRVACEGPSAVTDPLLQGQLTAASRIRGGSAAAGTAPAPLFSGASVDWCGGGNGGSSCGGSSCGGSSGGGSSCGGSSGGGGCGGGGGGGGGGCGGGGGG